MCDWTLLWKLEQNITNKDDFLCLKKNKYITKQNI